MSRHCPNHPLCKFTVRIDEHHPATVDDVLQCKRLEKCRLTRPRLPDDVHMRKPVGLLDANRKSPIRKFVRAKKDGESSESSVMSAVLPVRHALPRAAQCRIRHVSAPQHLL